ncbi:MAG: SpoIID/LytB domain-containing protein [Deltaproteobacteria bacterium]|nr:SpoIID/LytB domain-containing protein [Deltaproteobacteria bacterium]
MEWENPRDGSLRCLFLSLFPLIFVVFGISSARAANVPTVRVMVEREKLGVRVEGFDLIFSDPETGKTFLHEPKRVSIAVKCTLGGVMKIGPRGLKVSGPVKVESLGGFVRVESGRPAQGDGRQYRDALYLYSFNGDCIVVNHVDLEKYVAGLLDSEMNARWNFEALKAQAVAARTYALFQMKEGSSPRFRGLRPPFDLDSTEKDQVYEGAHKERYRALRAVEETRGQVLAYQGHPIKAFYHSTCGGHTESPERVWGAHYPYMKPVRCGFCESSPRFNWSSDLRSAALEASLRKAGLLAGRLRSIRVLQRNRGRVERVEIRGDGGRGGKSVRYATGARLRELAGTALVRSTDFTVSRSSDKIVFVGHGSGHGVGMCQWGAKVMGERGNTYAQILARYYPEAGLTRMY